MSTVGSGSPSPAATASPPAVEDTNNRWAPHGPLLTACVAGINVFMILLIFYFFWRFFSGRRPGPSASPGAAADDGDDASSSDSLPVASPWAFRRRQREVEDGPRLTPLEDVAAALPVYVYSGAADGDEGGTTKAAECAVCIVELRDGDAARLLPRCGHRFHADCVGAWLRIHATCPLCRASVVAPAATAASGEARNDDAKDDDDDEADAGADSPV